jgi:hypothetical protein
MDLLFFEKPMEHNPILALTSITLLNGAVGNPYQVQPAEKLRYLRFLIPHHLKWEPHVHIMCNQSHMSIKALQIREIPLEDYLWQTGSCASPSQVSLGITIAVLARPSMIHPRPGQLPLVVTCPSSVPDQTKQCSTAL